MCAALAEVVNPLKDSLIDKRLPLRMKVRSRFRNSQLGEPRWIQGGVAGVRDGGRVCRDGECESKDKGPGQQETLEHRGFSLRTEAGIGWMRKERLKSGLRAHVFRITNWG